MEVKNNIIAPELNAGDEVIWTIRPRGNERKIKCWVVEIIPPGRVPDRDKYPTLYKKHDAKKQREHHSYIIREDKPTDVHNQFHWPRLNELSLEPGFQEAFAEMAKDEIALVEAKEFEGTLGDGMVTMEPPIIGHSSVLPDFSEEASDSEIANEALEIPNRLSTKERDQLLRDAMKKAHGKADNPAIPVAPEPAKVWDSVDGIDSVPIQNKYIPEVDGVEAFVTSSTNTVTKVISGLARDFISLLAKELPRGDGLNDLRTAYNLLQYQHGELLKQFDQQYADIKELKANKPDQNALYKLGEKEAELAKKERDLEQVRKFLDTALKEIEVLSEENDELQSKLDRTLPSSDGEPDSELEKANAYISRLQQELENTKGQVTYLQRKPAAKAKNETNPDLRDLVRFAITKERSSYTGYNNPPRESEVDVCLKEFQEERPVAAVRHGA